MARKEEKHVYEMDNKQYAVITRTVDLLFTKQNINSAHYKVGGYLRVSTDEVTDNLYN